MLYLRTRPILFIIMAATLALGLSIPAFAGGGDDAAKTPQRKIVVFRSSVASEAERDEVESHTGTAKVKDLPLINGAVVLADSASEKALRQHANVLRVDDDAIVHTLDNRIERSRPRPTPTPTPKPTPTPPGSTPTPTPSPSEALPWGVARIGAELVWDKDNNMAVDPGANAGGGVKVVVLDTGIDLTHPDLAANVKGGINTINLAASPNDDNGHGSHVVGIIAAVDNTIGVLGVAPQASLYAVKVLNSQGSGYISDIIEGIQWSITNGMQVINMSFGSGTDIQSFHDALTAAYNSGVVLVAAAGNSGPGDNTVIYPAKYPEVIAVSATDSNNNLASFSSRGSQVEVAAPGMSIYSTYKGGTYATLSGTSMASPHVAGTAALVIASGIADTNGIHGVADEVRAKLDGTATDLGAAGRDNLYGYGLVNAYSAATP